MAVPNRLCVIFLYLFESTYAALRTNSKCSNYERVSSSVYKCSPGFRHYQCYPGYGIPTWRTHSKSDPCICLINFGGSGQLACPDPLGDLIKDDFGKASRVDKIYDKGCPGPFLKYTDTGRIPSNMSFPVTLRGSKHAQGVSSLEEECKFRCLTLGACRGVSFSMANGVAACLVYLERPKRSEMVSNTSTNYFWKLESCPNSDDARSDDPDKLQITEVDDPSLDIQLIGTIFENSQQHGGLQLPGHVTQQQCFRLCMTTIDCAGADYNQHLRACFMHKQSSCTSHHASAKGCCVHFVKDKTC